MATYAMKDASDLTLVERGTNKVIFKADYANTTNVEWKADRVFAKKKGANAVAFDAARTAEMTVESEIFDFRLLAILAGDKLNRGANDVFQSERFTLTDDRLIKLAHTPEAGTISVFRLNSDGITHDQSVPQVSDGTSSSVPAMPTDVAVSAKDTTADVSWGTVNGATSYLVYRDGAQIAQPTGTTFKDSDLKPQTTYKYQVVAVNAAGPSSFSAEVVVKTAVAGTESAGAAVKATPEAINAATKDAEVLNANGLNFKVKDNGQLQLSDAAVTGAEYVVYYVSKLDGVSNFTIEAQRFANNYEIYADAWVVERETGEKHFVQVHYPNAKPQGNFTFNQNSKEPTSLSIKFDLLPNEKDQMAIWNIIED